MRLNAFLAKAGVAPRRKADELIKQGRVKLNGRVGQLNDDVSEKDLIELDNKQIEMRKSRYILLYKPPGYLSTLKDTHGRKKVIDLINIPERVVPVGRLDNDTTGVLLLTSDGEFAHKLMHPSFKVRKTYLVEIKESFTHTTLDSLRSGVELEDGLTAPAKVEQIAPNKIELTIHEGRNRQIKRMIKTLGFELKSLHRSKYGNVTLHDLNPGEWRDLAPSEVKSLEE